MSHSLPGWIHFAAAAIALLLGLVQVIRPKGDRLHRRIGYCYVAALVICDAGALAVFQFTGRVNLFHVAAIVNLGCVLAGVFPFFRSPRPLNWRVRHAIFMGWSYIGLWAAGLTEAAVRLVPWTSIEQVIGVTTAVTLAVTLGGWRMLRGVRNALRAKEGSVAT